MDALVTAVVITLLVIAVASTVLSVAGVALMRGAQNRLHYLGPATVVGAPAVAIAIVLKESFNTRGLKALLVAGILALLNPVLIHAIARAARAKGVE